MILLGEAAWKTGIRRLRIRRGMQHKDLQAASAGVQIVNADHIEFVCNQSLLLTWTANIS